eukprot:2602813-Rhodomonas_salina.2
MQKHTSSVRAHAYVTRLGDVRCTVAFPSENTAKRKLFMETQERESRFELRNISAVLQSDVTGIGGRPTVHAGESKLASLQTCPGKWPLEKCRGSKGAGAILSDLENCSRFVLGVAVLLPRAATNAQHGQGGTRNFKSRLELERQGRVVLRL